MRVLLDESVPHDLAAELVGHEVRTVSGMGWAGTRNGALLRLAEGQFDVFVTMDRGIEFQQNFSKLAVGIVLVRAASNRMLHLRPLVSAMLSAIEGIRAGELRSVG
jgi:hypothetical protein